MEWENISGGIKIDGEWWIPEMEEGISQVWGGELSNSIDTLWEEHWSVEIIMESSGEIRYIGISSGC